jgi:peroxiredoxin
MPSIHSLYETVDRDKIVFIMLSLDSPENHKRLSKYIQEKEFTFPVYVPHESLPRQLNVSSIPTTFIIGKDGEIKSKKVGTANYDTEEFKTFLNSLAE